MKIRTLIAILLLAFVTTAYSSDLDTGGGAGGTGAFSDAGDPVVLNTTTKDVVIGTGAVNASKLTVDGDADQVQLTVQGNGTQTDSIVIIENSAGAEVITLDKSGIIFSLVGIDGIGAIDFDIGSGDITDITLITDGGTVTIDGSVTAPGGFIAGRSATPSLIFGDSDTTDNDDNLKIFGNCTNTSSGAENCDMTFQQQIGGNMTTFFLADADGDLDFQDRNLANLGTVEVGTAGVLLSDDADGAITFLGQGDGEDEDLTLNLDDTANQITVSSSTGVITIALTGTITTLTTAAADNPYLVLDDNDDADFYIINDDVGQELEFSTDSTVGNNNMATLSEGGTFTSVAGVTVGTLLALTPQSLTVTTEADITLTGSMLLLTGDNDSDNDTIDLQNGTVTGQTLTIVGVALIDADDTITVAMTDTTCTGCLTVLLDEIGDTWGLVWTGSTWATTSNSEVQ